MEREPAVSSLRVRSAVLVSTVELINLAWTLVSHVFVRPCSKFTPASTNPLKPPLVVSWHTNEVATGSIEPVKEILQKMRVKQWKEQELERREPSQLQDLARRVRAWWTEHD
jgi:hypothetical protein